MHPRLVTIAATGATVVLLTGLAAASPAVASPAVFSPSFAVTAARTWTVTPGGASTATSGKLTLTDTTTKKAGVCASSTVGGTVRAGSGLPGRGIGSVVTVALHTCTGPFKIHFTVTARDLPWSISFHGYNAKTGVVRGTVSHLRITLVTKGCRAVVNGTASHTADGLVAASYTDGTGVLRFLPTGGNLHFWHVTGCTGPINSGDPAAFAASYQVSPLQVITSP